MSPTLIFSIVRQNVDIDPKGTQPSPWHPSCVQNTLFAAKLKTGRAAAEMATWSGEGRGGGVSEAGFHPSDLGPVDLALPAALLRPLYRGFIRRYQQLMAALSWLWLLLRNAVRSAPVDRKCLGERRSLRTVSRAVRKRWCSILCDVSSPEHE